MKIKCFRITSLLICFAMIFALFGCSDKTDDAKNAPEKDDADGITGEKGIDNEGADPFDTGYLPEYDLKGRDFKIIAYGQENGTGLSYYWSEAEIGENVNDSMYRRNVKVEERFDLRLNFTILADNNLSNRITNSINAGDNEYDLFIIHPAQYAQSLLFNGWTRNWNDVNAINLDKPWWHQNIRELLEINGYLPFVVSDFVFPSIIHTFMMVYNKQLQADLGVEKIYNLVDAGKWTWDKFNEIIKPVTIDLDGDGKMGTGDRYGFAANSMFHVTAMAYGAGIKSIELDKNDYPEIVLYKNENSIKFLDMMRELFDSKIIYEKDVSEINAGTYSPISWDSNQILFETTWLMKMPEMRNDNSDYGIIPFPKWDESQAQYHTFTDGRGSVLALPIYHEDIEMVGAVVEALSAESKRMVLPAYFENTLNAKFARDEDSIRMLQIILDGRVYDFGYMYRNSGEAITGIFQTLMTTRSKGFASYYESQYDNWKAHFDGIYEKYQELSDQK